MVPGLIPPPWTGPTILDVAQGTPSVPTCSVLVCEQRTLARQLVESIEARMLRGSLSPTGPAAPSSTSGIPEVRFVSSAISPCRMPGITAFVSNRR